MKIIARFFLLLSMFMAFLPLVQVCAQSTDTTDIDHLPAFLVYESEDLEAFSHLKIDLVSSYIEVQRGSDYKIEIYASQEDVAMDDLFSLTIDKETVHIDEKDWKNNLVSFLTTLTSRIIVTVPETERLGLVIDLVNGEVQVDGTLTEFEFDGPNAKIFLKGKETYPMAIDIVNGEIELTFDTYNADLDFEFVNGRYEILGDTMSASFSDYQKTLGDGRDEINIEAVNGKVLLIEAK